jgi:hypothetical protein
VTSARASKGVLAGDPAKSEDALYEPVVTSRPDVQQIIISIGVLLDPGYGNSGSSSSHRDARSTRREFRSERNQQV